MLAIEARHDEVNTEHPGALEGDQGNEPGDGSYPPDGADLLSRTVPGAHMMSPKMLVHERSRRALELRKVGVKYEDIARELGYANGTGAIKAVQRAMKNTLSESASELRQLQYNRLNEMLSRWYPLAMGGRRQVTDPKTGVVSVIDFPPSLEASKECRAIIAQLDELMGTGIGKKVTVSGQVQHDHEHSGEITHNEGTIVVDFDGDGWQAALRRATQEGLADGTDGSETGKFEVKGPSGYIAPALTALPEYDETDIIDAEVVEAGSKFDPRAAFKLDNKKNDKEEVDK